MQAFNGNMKVEFLTKMYTPTHSAAQKNKLESFTHSSRSTNTPVSEFFCASINTTTKCTRFCSSYHFRKKSSNEATPCLTYYMYFFQIWYLKSILSLIVSYFLVLPFFGVSSVTLTKQNTICSRDWYPLKPPWPRVPVICMGTIKSHSVLVGLFKMLVNLLLM